MFYETTTQEFVSDHGRALCQHQPRAPQARYIDTPSAQLFFVEPNINTELYDHIVI